MDDLIKQVLLNMILNVKVVNELTVFNKIIRDLLYS